MQVKLTLRLEESLIRRAKHYARRHGRSVSQIVAAYFSLLCEEPYPGELTLSPAVSSLKGILKGGETVDKQDYRHFLEEKYL